MPEPLRASEVEGQKDPTVAKQFDTETPFEQQAKDFEKLVDGLKTGLLLTTRKGVGPVGRAMAVAKRNGPDFIFLANINSQKFKDIDNDSTVTVTFSNSSSMDWASITGRAMTASNSDPRIKELYSKGTNAWFGDLGDGKHDGGPDDPRMALIEVKADYVAYWVSSVTKVGYTREVVQAGVTGQLAQTGYLREFKGSDLEKLRG